jgi:hypothetical protein
VGSRSDSKAMVEPNFVFLRYKCNVSCAVSGCGEFLNKMRS